MPSPKDTKINTVTKTTREPIVPQFTPDSSVRPGIYTNPRITVDRTGIITDAENATPRLVDLPDVDAANVTTGDGLIYNSSTGKWEASAAGGGSGLTHPQVMKRINIGL